MAAESDLNGTYRSEQKEREGGDVGVTTRTMVTRLPLFMLKAVWVARIGRCFLPSHHSGFLPCLWCFLKFEDGSSTNRTIHP